MCEFGKKKVSVYGNVLQVSVYGDVLKTGTYMNFIMYLCVSLRMMHTDVSQPFAIINLILMTTSEVYILIISLSLKMEKLRQ